MELRPAHFATLPKCLAKFIKIFVSVAFLFYIQCVCFANDIITNPNYHGTKTTIRYSLWGGASEVQEAKTDCAWFVQKYPNIEVEIAVYPWGEYWTKVQTEMASGIAPDVMSFYSGSFGTWVQRGALMPLDNLLKQDNFSLQGLFPVAIKNCSWDGSLYSMPNNIAIWSLVYSKDRFEERGIPQSQWPKVNKALSWQNFIKLQSELTLQNADGSFRQFGMSAGQNFEATLVSMDGGFFVDRQVNPTKATIVGNTKLLDGLIKLMDSEYANRTTLGSVPLSTDSSVNNTDTILTSSRFAMGTAGPWALAQLKEAGVRFGVSPMPEGAFPFNLVNVNSVGISSTSKYPRAAAKFVEFLASLRAQQLVGSTMKGVPALKAAVPSLLHNKYNIPGCEAFVQDTLRGIPSVTTDDNAINSDITNFFTDLGQTLDNLYDSNLAKLPRANGVISPQNYDDFLKDMKGNVARICQAKLMTLNSKLTADFLAENTPEPSIVQKIIWPLIISVLCLIFVSFYLKFVRRKSQESIGGGMAVSNRVGYFFLSPWLFGLVCFTLGPLLIALFLSFTTWNMVQPPVWIGVAHYANLSHNQYFWMGIKKTFLYALLVIPISLCGGLLTAGLLTTRIKGNDLFKAIIYLPSLFTGAEAAVLWIHILNKDHGILNAVLGWLHIAPVNWLDANHAFYSVVMMNLFWVGGAMIIYYAGMKQIPAVLYEAADIDGATSAKKFMSITIPLLSPVILFLLVITTIGAFQVFTPALFFASSANAIGGPDNSLRFYAVNIYDAAFNKLQMGLACTYAVVLFFIIFVVTMVQMHLAKKYVYLESGP